MIKGKVIIVIGASGGIGSAIVPRFVEEGAKVTLSARTREKLETVASGLPADQILISPGDANIAKDLEKVFAETVEKFGRIDCVIISAGTWRQLGINDDADAAYAQALQLFQSIFLPSFMSAFVAQKFLRMLGGGWIVNISSHAAVRPDLNDNLVYGPLKAATHHLVKVLRCELEGTPVRVSDLMPGIVNTPAVKDEETRQAAVQPEEIVNWIIKHIDDKDPPESHLFKTEARASASKD